MKRHPNAFDYLTCYPEAVKLWRAGKFQEAANSFVHSPANLILGNEEQKAAHYAKERQATVTNSATAKAHIFSRLLFSRHQGLKVAKRRAQQAAR